MRWRLGRRSTNVEDRRGRRLGRKTAGGGLGFIIILIIGMFLGIDPSTLLNMQSGIETASVPDNSQTTTGSINDELADFVSAVLADTEDTWNDLFRQLDGKYSEPRLVFFPAL